jgi:pimeloyl-ACP methyl ester carboxylesterase
VIVPDLRGHGRAAPSPKDAGLDDLVDDLLDLLDALRVERAALVGLSLGGLVSLHATLRAPGRVSALGLVATPASAETPESAARRFGTLETMGRIGTRPVLRGMAGWLFGRFTRCRHPQVVEAWLDEWAMADPAAICRTARAALRRPDARPRLGGVHVPTLVVVGTEDGVLPPDEGEALAEGIPGATLHEVARAGHLLPLERPEALGSLLDHWLEAVDGRAVPVEEDDDARSLA